MQDETPFASVIEDLKYNPCPECGSKEVAISQQHSCCLKCGRIGPSIDFIKDNVKEYDFEALISTDFDINKLKYRNTVVFILSLLENIIREKEILFKYTDETIEHIVPRTDWVNKGYKISNERLINYFLNV